MKQSLRSLVLLVCVIHLCVRDKVAAAQTDIIGPAGSAFFGEAVKVLPNGNFVVLDPGYSTGQISGAGRVYLYNGATLALINTMTGTAANDAVGSSGVTVLANGDYVIASSFWNGGTGAVTRCSASTGCPATISAANSLVGSATTDRIGSDVTALPSGNYVVQSPGWGNAATATLQVGAVTWCSGTATCVGAVSTANSLVGSTAGDQVGAYVVTVLANGNYVVVSSVWNNGAASFAGALTRCSGTAVCTGTVSPANSLVGSTTNDSIGNYGITPLTNGGYVVNSPYWDNGGLVDAGAATFCNAAGCTGVISATNSLIGSTANDQVGLTSVALNNGNYVVGSPFWDNGPIVDAGAATFGNGATGRVGAITQANSLVGTTASDQIGSSATALTNGNYVVGSPNWDNIAASISNAGAATWCSGTAGCTGTVTAANSLTGPSAGDAVGGAMALANGNYVVSSPYWDNHAPFAADAGAVTFCNGASGCVGMVVTSVNSLVGSTGNDRVGNNNSLALSNGNYVVLTSGWTNGGIAHVGAATFCSGTTGCNGTIMPGNSLIGTAAGDQVGTLGLALTNGNYVVLSPNWANGGITGAGAITRGGSSGITGAVTSANSLVGSTMNDALGNTAVATALPNGNYVVRSPDWDNGGIVDAGAVSYGLGGGGTVGPITAANSVRGTIASGGADQNYSIGSGTQLVVGRPDENIVTVFAGSAGPQVTSVVSRKLHNGVPFDVVLPLTGGPAIECRSGGATSDYQLIFTFPSAVTFNSASVTTGTGTVSSTTGSGTTAVAVNLTGVANAQRITVTLAGVSNGSGTGDVSAQLGVLIGDANGDGFVNAGDALQTRNRSGQATDANNFRSDVNLDGFVNSGDSTIVRSRSGTSLP